MRASPLFLAVKQERKLRVVACNYLSLGQFALARASLIRLHALAPASAIAVLDSVLDQPLPAEWICTASVPSSAHLRRLCALLRAELQGAPRTLSGESSLPEARAFDALLATIVLDCEALGRAAQLSLHTLQQLRSCFYSAAQTAPSAADAALVCAPVCGILPAAAPVLRFSSERSLSRAAALDTTSLRELRLVMRTQPALGTELWLALTRALTSGRDDAEQAAALHSWCSQTIAALERIGVALAAEAMLRGEPRALTHALRALQLHREAARAPPEDAALSSLLEAVNVVLNQHHAATPAFPLAALRALAGDHGGGGDHGDDASILLPPRLGLRESEDSARGVVGEDIAPALRWIMTHHARRNLDLRALLLPLSSRWRVSKVFEALLCSRGGALAIAQLGRIEEQAIRAHSAVLTLPPPFTAYARRGEVIHRVSQEQCGDDASPPLAFQRNLHELRRQQFRCFWGELATFTWSFDGHFLEFVLQKALRLIEQQDFDGTATLLAPLPALRALVVLLAIDRFRDDVGGMRRLVAALWPSSPLNDDAAGAQAANERSSDVRLEQWCDQLRYRLTLASWYAARYSKAPQRLIVRNSDANVFSAAEAAASESACAVPPPPPPPPLSPLRSLLSTPPPSPATSPPRTPEGARYAATLNQSSCSTVLERQQAVMRALKGGERSIVGVMRGGLTAIASEDVIDIIGQRPSGSVRDDAELVRDAIVLHSYYALRTVLTLSHTIASSSTATRSAWTTPRRPTAGAAAASVARGKKTPSSLLSGTMATSRASGLTLSPSPPKLDRRAVASPFLPSPPALERRRGNNMPFASSPASPPVSSRGDRSTGQHRRRRGVPWSGRGKRTSESRSSPNGESQNGIERAMEMVQLHVLSIDSMMWRLTLMEHIFRTLFLRRCHLKRSTDVNRHLRSELIDMLAAHSPPRSMSASPVKGQSNSPQLSPIARSLHLRLSRVGLQRALVRARRGPRYINSPHTPLKRRSKAASSRSSDASDATMRGKESIPTVSFFLANTDTVAPLLGMLRRCIIATRDDMLRFGAFDDEEVVAEAGGAGAQRLVATARVDAMDRWVSDANQRLQSVLALREHFSYDGSRTPLMSRMLATPQSLLHIALKLSRFEECSRLIDFYHLPEESARAVHQASTLEQMHDALHAQPSSISVASIEAQLNAIVAESPRASDAPIRIVSLAEAPHHVHQIAKWHFAAWRADNAACGLHSVGEIEADFEEYYLTDADLPTIFVALEDDIPCGTATVDNADMCESWAREHWGGASFGPWIAAVYVRRESRGRGVATAMVRHALRYAAACLHVREINLWFPKNDEATLRGLYTRLGWCEHEQTEYCGEPICIGSFTLGGGLKRATNAEVQVCTMLIDIAVCCTVSLAHSQQLLERAEELMAVRTVEDSAAISLVRSFVQYALLIMRVQLQGHPQILRQLHFRDISSASAPPIVSQLHLSYSTDHSSEAALRRLFVHIESLPKSPSVLDAHLTRLQSKQEALDALQQLGGGAAPETGALDALHRRAANRTSERSPRRSVGSGTDSLLRSVVEALSGAELESESESAQPSLQYLLRFVSYMMEVSSVLNTAAEPTSTSDALAILHTEPCAILRTVAFDRTSPREAQHLARLMNISLLKVLMRATRPDDIRSPNPTHYTLSTSMVPFLDELEGANPLSGLCAEEGRIVTALACLLRGVSSLLDGAFLASALRLSRPFPVLHRYIEGKANAADGIFHALQESGEQTRSEKNDDQDHLVAMLQYDERDFARWSTFVCPPLEADDPIALHVHAVQDEDCVATNALYDEISAVAAAAAATSARSFDSSQSEVRTETTPVRKGDEEASLDLHEIELRLLNLLIKYPNDVAHDEISKRISGKDGICRRMEAFQLLESVGQHAGEICLALLARICDEHSAKLLLVQFLRSDTPAAVASRAVMGSSTTDALDVHELGLCILTRLSNKAQQRELSHLERAPLLLIESLIMSQRVEDVRRLWTDGSMPAAFKALRDDQLLINYATKALAFCSPDDSGSMKLSTPCGALTGAPQRDAALRAAFVYPNTPNVALSLSLLNLTSSDRVAGHACIDIADHLSSALAPRLGKYCGDASHIAMRLMLTLLQHANQLFCKRTNQWQRINSFGLIVASDSDRNRCARLERCLPALRRLHALSWQHSSLAVPLMDLADDERVCAIVRTLVSPAVDRFQLAESLCNACNIHTDGLQLARALIQIENGDVAAARAPLFASLSALSPPASSGGEATRSRLLFVQVVEHVVGALEHSGRSCTPRAASALRVQLQNATLNHLQWEHESKSATATAAATTTVRRHAVCDGFAPKDALRRRAAALRQSRARRRDKKKKVEMTTSIDAAIFLLARFGEPAEHFRYLMRHGLLDQACRIAFERYVEPRLFGAQVVGWCLGKGAIEDLHRAISYLNSVEQRSLRTKGYLGATSRYLNAHGHNAALLSFQTFIVSHAAAATTCQRMFKASRSIAERVNHLEAGCYHITKALEKNAAAQAIDRLEAERGVPTSAAHANRYDALGLGFAMDSCCRDPLSAYVHWSVRRVRAPLATSPRKLSAADERRIDEEHDAIVCAAAISALPRLQLSAVRTSSPRPEKRMRTTMSRGGEWLLRTPQQRERSNSSIKLRGQLLQQQLALITLQLEITRSGGVIGHLSLLTPDEVAEDLGLHRSAVAAQVLLVSTALGARCVTTLQLDVFHSYAVAIGRIATGAHVEQRHVRSGDSSRLYQYAAQSSADRLGKVLRAARTVLMDAAARGGSVDDEWFGTTGGATAGRYDIATAVHHALSDSDSDLGSDDSDDIIDTTVAEAVGNLARGELRAARFAPMWAHLGHRVAAEIEQNDRTTDAAVFDVLRAWWPSVVEW